MSELIPEDVLSGMRADKASRKVVPVTTEMLTLPLRDNMTPDAVAEQHAIVCATYPDYVNLVRGEAFQRWLKMLSTEERGRVGQSNDAEEVIAALGEFKKWEAFAPIQLPSRFQIGDAVMVSAGPGKQKRFDPLGNGGAATIESVTFTADKVYYGVHGGTADSCDVTAA